MIGRDDSTRLPGSGQSDVIRLTGLRKTIAERMVQSHSSAPHVTLTMKVDVTKLMGLKEETERRIGAQLSYNAILIKVVAVALEKHPILNSTLAGDEITIQKEINVGLAISLRNGLIVPVIRNANKCSLLEINRIVEDLVSRARANKLSIGEVTGGTFTLTNLGMFGVETFTPIIVLGQAAILGVGMMSDEVKALEAQIVIRKIMSLSLSFDHRIVDGAEAAQFLSGIKTLLEQCILDFQ